MQHVLSVRACIPVVFVSEVVYNSGTDACHAPLAAVPSSCDDRELRSAQTLLTLYTERGQRRRSTSRKLPFTAVITNANSEGVTALSNKLRGQCPAG